MNIIINGNPTEQPESTTVLSLLEAKGLDPATVVVELNRAIVPGEHFETTALTDGDTLEILRLVGGG